MTKLDTVNDAVAILQKGGSLTEGQAKTCVYYACVTHQIKHIKMIPPVVLFGPTGTGKTEIAKVTGQLCFSASDLVDCTGWTTAAFRDFLEKHQEKTVLLDESHRTQYPRQTDNYLRTRSSKAKIEVKEDSVKGYVQTPKYLFGATVTTRQDLMRDQSVQNRAIILTTKKKQGGGFLRDQVVGDELKKAVAELAEGIDFDAEPPLPGDFSGRVVDVWRPLLLVALSVPDTDYLIWAWDQMRAAESSLSDGHDYEPQGLVLSRLLELCTEEDTTTHELKLKSSMGRIKVDEEIGNYLRKHYVPYPDPQTVTGILRHFGFALQRSGGRTWVYPTEANLKAAAQELGLEDDLLK